MEDHESEGRKLRLPDGEVFRFHVNRKGTAIEFESKELVYCKHCIYSQLLLTEPPLYCTFLERWVDDDFYCAYGKYENGGEK